LPFKFYYIHETVEQIKILYDEFSEEIQQLGKWNLSIDDFKEVNKTRLKIINVL
jgi:hypothetical protein